MKHYLLLALLISSFCACTNKKAQQEKMQAQKDSIAEMEKAKALLKKNQELAEIAYGDAKFGMTVEEAQKTNVCKDSRLFLDYDEIKKIDLISLDYEQSEIGSTSFDIEFRFFNNRLYRAHFDSNPIQSNEYNGRLKQHLEELKDIISVKYGEPRSAGFPDMQELSSTQATLVYSWQCLTKGIQIGVQASTLADHYKYIMTIYDIPTLQAINRNIQKEKEKTITDDAKMF